MRIALVCSGIGRELRGFEAFTESLYEALQRYNPPVDVTLFQGAGNGKSRRMIVPSLGRYGFPARIFGPRKAYMIETRSFGIAIYPFLKRGGYDIVHFNDLLIGSVLFHLRRIFGGKFKLLYCNGAPSPAVHYHHRCDAAQLLTGPHYEEAVAFGIGLERLFLLPYGVDAEYFSPDLNRFRLKIRGELGIPEDARVILTVAALKREHKRIDYLLKEISQVEGSPWLIAAGQTTEETESLKEEAELFLPGRYRFVSWPHERVRCLYGAADVFTLGSLYEGFGLAIIEAMLSGLPVIIHNNPSFQWIAGEGPVCLVEMSKPGELKLAISETLSTRSIPCGRKYAYERFSWSQLIPQYVNMYEKVSILNAPSA